LQHIVPLADQGLVLRRSAGRKEQHSNFFIFILLKIDCAYKIRRLYFIFTAKPAEKRFFNEE
jgi:hypothetical protein